MFVATAATPPVAVRQTSASTTPLATALTAQAAMKPSSQTLALTDHALAHEQRDADEDGGG